MPFRNPAWSPILPMITGTTAPPMPIPVPRIPANEPWCSATELSASEITIGHITEANNPIAGNARHETSADPNNAADRQSKAPMEAPIRTLRLSKIFSSSIPTKQPAVIKPQNHETAAAPVVWGSKPWYWARNLEIQSAVPCSQPTYASIEIKYIQTTFFRAKLRYISNEPALSSVVYCTRGNFEMARTATISRVDTAQIQ